MNKLKEILADRRLDLEMTRRGIPLWRSDYNCKVYPDSTEANQAHTFGLSFWLPVNGVNVNFGSEYGARSSIFCGNLFTYDSCGTEYFGAYTAEREMLVKNFYPISCGGVNMRKITAMQYGDEAAGQALIYKHKRAKTGPYPVVFSGVETDAEYKVWSVDDPSLWVRLTGGELMAGKYSVSLPAGEKALIVKYEKQ